jgi:hypothetical protein
MTLLGMKQQKQAASGSYKYSLTEQHSNQDSGGSIKMLSLSVVAVNTAIDASQHL